MVRGSGIPYFPTAGVQMIHAPDYAPSVLNSVGAQCGYLEEVQTLMDLSGNGRHAVRNTAPRPLYLAFAGRNYLWMQGVPGTGTAGGSSLAYSAAMVLDEFTFETEMALDDWTPTAAGCIACRFEQGTSAGWVIYIATNGQLQFQWFVPGATLASSTANLAFANNQKAFIRVHYTRNTGSGQYAVVFSTSTDGITYTQLGTTLTGASTAAIANTGTPALRLGNGATVGLQGRLYYFALRAGGPTASKVANWDSSFASHLSLTSLESVSSLVFTHSRGATTNSTRALVAKGCIYTDGNQMILSNPLASSSADYITGCLSCCELTSRRTISYATQNTTASINPYAVFLSGTTAASSNSAAIIQSVGAATPNIRNRVIARQVGAVGYIERNGTVTAPAPAASVVAHALDRLFARGLDTSSAVYGRMGHWTGATLPTEAEVQSYLEG